MGQNHSSQQQGPPPIEEDQAVCLPKSGELFFDELTGCKRQDLCRLLCVRQARALRRVAEGLSVSCGADLKPLFARAPKVPVKSIFTRYVDGVVYWTKLKAFVKEVSNMTPAEVRPFFCSRNQRRSSKVGADPRHSLSFSLSLLGKAIHPPCRCYGHAASKADEHRASITRELPVDLAYVGFARQVASRYFKRGWDSSYRKSCVVSVPSTNGCYEKRRSEYGAASMRWLNSQRGYLRRVLGEADFEIDPIGRYTEVCSAGKIRPLSIMHSSYELLRPLHKTLYNTLSRSPWLLRGQPNTERFPFLNDEGQFVSIDFESATDNLRVEVAEAILQAAFTRSTHIPDCVKEQALRALRPTIEYDPLETLFGESPELKCGQMMGSLLSFPLLCFQTFVFYLWSTGQTDLSGKQLRRFDRCLINGDDLVCKEKEPDSLFAASLTTPSVINKKKTQVSSVYFNINSTLFKKTRGGVRSVPFLRPAQFDMQKPIDLGTTIRDATRYLSPRSELQKRSFDWLMREGVRKAKAYGWSLRGCGFRGMKQFTWLKGRGLCSYEADVTSFKETVVPREEPIHAVPLVPAPRAFKDLSPAFYKEIGAIYNAFARFNFRFLKEKEPYSLERECEKRRFDVKQALLDADRRMTKARRLWKLSGFLAGRYPLPVGQTLYASRKQHRRVELRKILVREKAEKELLPLPLVQFLESPYLMIEDRASTRTHPLVVEEVLKILRKYKRKGAVGEG